MGKKRGFALIILPILVALLAGGVIPTAAAYAAAAGTGPEEALTPSGDWQPIEAGEGYWYAFQYTGDGSQIQIRLEASPPEGAAFEVWTPGEIERRGLGLEAQPIGRGSTDAGAGGALLWSGHFYEGGTYYAFVEHAGSQPGTSYYLLTIDGEGVSFAPSGDAAGPAPTATPRPEPARTPAPGSGKISGKLVFQTTYGGDFYTIQADGTGLRRITDGIDPTWSPAPQGESAGGQQIAFTRWREPRGVWVVDVSSGEERRVFDWSEARWPSWSPDGAQIVFSRHTGGTSGREFCFRGFCFQIPARDFWKLGIVNTGDGDFGEPLPNSDASLAPDWSPDGERIVYDAVQGLQIQSVDGTVSYQITDDARDTSPTWSPDGERIAFTRRQHDHWEIYLVEADGGHLRRLTDSPTRPDGQPGNSAAAAWSPDGQYLAFLTDRSGKWEIWVMGADGSNPRPMFDTELDGLVLDYGFVSERALSWSR